MRRRRSKRMGGEGVGDVVGVAFKWTYKTGLPFLSGEPPVYLIPIQALEWVSVRNRNFSIRTSFCYTLAPFRIVAPSNSSSVDLVFPISPRQTVRATGASKRESKA